MIGRDFLFPITIHLDPVGGHFCFFQASIPIDMIWYYHFKSLAETDSLCN
jgi:hypothetical protein